MRAITTLNRSSQTGKHGHSSFLSLIVTFETSSGKLESPKCIPGPCQLTFVSLRLFSLKLKRFLFYLGQHDVFIEFVPFKIILNLKKYSEKNCLCPVWTHCKLWIDGNVIKPVTKEYFHIVIFVDHVKLAKLKMKAEMLRLFCHLLSYLGEKTFQINLKIPI